MNLFENLQKLNESCYVESTKSEFDTSKYDDSEVDKSTVKNRFDITYKDGKYHASSERNADKFKRVITIWGEENAKALKKEIEKKGYEIIHVYNGVGKKVTLGESKIIKDEKDIEQVVESTELRPFTGRDHMTWGGEHNFADGSAPLIVDGEFATILVGQSDDQVGTEEACISIYYGDPESDRLTWGFKIYDDKESAVKDAKILAKLADDEIDENQLSRFGFELVSCG